MTQKTITVGELLKELPKNSPKVLVMVDSDQDKDLYHCIDDVYTVTTKDQQTIIVLHSPAPELHEYGDVYHELANRAPAKPGDS